MNDDALTALQDAVVKYVESKGGNVVVIGPVLIQQQPGSRKLNFEVVISGNPPTKSRGELIAEGNAALEAAGLAPEDEWTDKKSER